MSDLKALTRLLKPAVATTLHPWRIILTSAGALSGTSPPAADDLLGFFCDTPLKLDSAAEARRAVELTALALDDVAAALADGRPVLELATAPPLGRHFALALADALFGFADGLDFAGVDPDTLGEDAAEVFEQLGRRAAATEALATMLPDEIDEPEVCEELRSLEAATNADVASFLAATQTGAAL